jgi:hypothetical protein
MATIPSTKKPGKLSSKFGAAFAAFEKNGNDPNSVPLAFQSITTNNNNNKARNSKYVNGHKTHNKVTESKSTAKDVSKDQPQNKHVNATSSNMQGPPVKRNFRVASTISNRAKMFESGSSTKKQNDMESTDQSSKNAFQRLRRVGGQESTLPHSNVKELATRTTEYLSDDEYIEIEITSEDEDLWEERTVESTDPDDDSCSWDEEIIEEELLVDWARRQLTRNF